MNKKLLIIVIVLIPITIISFFHKETNFIMDKNIIIKVNKDNELLEIPLEEYVIGVVGGEMPASFEEEALKAQAIASRTYVIKHLENKDTITSTISDQVYLSNDELRTKWKDNYDKYYNKIKEAVLSTKDKIITYNNEPIKAYYYSKSNGYTESSLNVFNEQNDYLNIIASPFEKDIEQIVEIPKEEFCTKLSITCNNITISNITRDESNRVDNLTVNNKSFKGTKFRKLLGLRSTDFDIEVLDNIKITTRGYGHGVGMSQYGANEMAKLGYNYEDILKYYYQNTEINNI